MTRCMNCNNLLTKEETFCVGCGTPAKQVEGAPGIGETLAKVVSLLYYVSVGLTLVCLFVPGTPSAGRYIIVTVALLVIKRSTDQMTAKNN
ncbi:MAG: hypothetical protein ABI165_06615 [Bryobacteraceae bacterium]